MNCHKRWPLRPLARALARNRFISSSTPPAVEMMETATAAFPLKHVTRSNFEAALSDLRSHVRAADFVSIDLEMTGVTSAPWRESLEFDRFDVRYLKVKDSAEKFAVVQFGVCPFRWDSVAESFIAHPYNFFVFPRQELTFDAPAHEFLCQTTSMDFLAKYQFDFNACVHEGISYLSRRQEEEATKRLEMLYGDEELDSVIQARDVKLARMADILFAERMKKKLSEWRDGLLRGGTTGALSPGTLNDSSQRFETIFYHMRPALSLKGFTSHQLRVIKLVLGKHFRDLLYVHVNDEHSCSQELVVYTDSGADMQNLMKKVKDENKRAAELKIKSVIGFRHVIDLLSSEQKLIVGHNCFLDIAHVYSKFVGPLPSTAEKFVSSINKHFPHIVDTKVLLNLNQALQKRMKKSSTSLSAAFSLLCPQIALGSNSSTLVFQERAKIHVEVDDVRSSNWNSGAKHEAGYDAFMTGCIFAQSCCHLGIDFKHHSLSQNLALNENLQDYINHLYLSWTNGDIINLQTGQRFAEYRVSNNLPKRFSKIKFENIVLIWGFPQKLKARDIKDCISRVFGPTSVTSIYHVDDSAVFVMFNNTELVSDFLALKQHLETTNDAISVLHPLSKLLAGGNTCAADYEAYKEICSSPISKVLFADQAEAVGVKCRTKLIQSNAEEVESVEQLKSGDENASQGQLTCEDMIDSFCADECRSARTSNL